MITISLSPYSFRRVLLGLVAAAAGLCCATAFAQPILFSVPKTPYDRQMSPIRSVLLSGAGAKGDLSVDEVNRWMWDLRSIPYGFSTQWKTPHEVTRSPYADCKGKSVALYARMKARGANNVRLVIGRRLPTSQSTHAWLEWQTAQGRYVLDPTINWSACRAEAVGRSAYRPLYAYAGTRKYRAVDSSTQTLVAAR